MKPHVIKYLYKDGVALIDKEAWCGKIIYNHDWAFLGTNHAIRAIESQMTTQPCEKCIAAIQTLLDNYNDQNTRRSPTQDS